MTDLNELVGLFEPDDTADHRVVVVERERRKCRHPRYARMLRATKDGPQLIGDPSQVRYCGRCGHEFDEAKVRRGRSARRLGGDIERRIEKVYGPRKVGEFGDPVDHLGRVWRWQSKATRAPVPKWLSVIDAPTPRVALPAVITRAWDHMAGLYIDRRPVVIRSFVSRGVRTRDWLFVHSFDATAELGLPAAQWHVIPGDWWLDHFGLDR